jgi:hypothetical protein
MVLWSGPGYHRSNRSPFAPVKLEVTSASIVTSICVSAYLHDLAHQLIYLLSAQAAGNHTKHQVELPGEGFSVIRSWLSIFSFASRSNHLSLPSGPEDNDPDLVDL